MIIRAVVKNGLLQPLEPLPEEWKEGRTLEIEGRLQPAEDMAEFERRWQEMESIIAQTPDDPEDDRRIEEAIAEHRRLSKQYVRRQMGLS